MADDDDAFTGAWNESWRTIGAGIGGCLPWIIVLAIVVVAIAALVGSCEERGSSSAVHSQNRVVAVEPPRQQIFQTTQKRDIAPLPIAPSPNPETVIVEEALSNLQNDGKYLPDIRTYLDAGGARGYNILAWHWATCPIATHINAQKALEYALRAVRAQPQDYNFTDTLAAAYARLGQFDQAIETQNAAIQKYQAYQRYFSPEKFALLQERLRIYERHLAYRADDQGR